MSTDPTPSREEPVVVRPIAQDEADRVVLRCWPERDALEALFAEQGTIGMAAWEGERNVGQLHCYRQEVSQEPLQRGAGQFRPGRRLRPDRRHRFYQAQCLASEDRREPY